MIDTGVRQGILEDLELMPPELQQRARELVHRLVSKRPLGASVEAAKSLAGTLDDQSAQQMMAAIEAEYEQLEPDAR